MGAEEVLVLEGWAGVWGPARSSDVAGLVGFSQSAESCTEGHLAALAFTLRSSAVRPCLCPYFSILLVVCLLLGWLNLRLWARLPSLPQVGYLSTWSSYQTYLKAHPGEEDPLARLKLELERELKAAGADLGAIEFSWPLFVILAKQPVPLEH